MGRRRATWATTLVPGHRTAAGFRLSPNSQRKTQVSPYASEVSSEPRRRGQELAAPSPAGPVADFCAELRRLVRGYGVRQAEISQVLDRSASSVSDLLNGRRRTAPDWDDVRLIVGLCEQQARRPRPTEGLRTELEYWRARYTELEYAVERVRAASPVTVLPASPLAPAPVVPFALNAAQVMHIDVATAMDLLADGRAELPDRPEVLLESLHTDGQPPFVLDALLEGLSQRVRAAHGLARSTLLWAVRLTLATALEQCTDRLDVKALDFVGLLVRSALEQDSAEQLGNYGAPSAGPAQQVRYDHCVHLITKLALSCPEFALTSTPCGTVVRAAADGPNGTGLAGLEGLLAECAGSDAGRRVSFPAVRQSLRDPIAALDFPDLRLPSLEHGYINPRFRLAPSQHTARLERSVASDKWWEHQPTYDTIEHFFAAYLLGLPALLSPLLVLGHPGAGKSLLTRLLVARLPADEFRPLRIELRHMPADKDVQTQLERALKDATGRSETWPDWSEAEPGVPPVVLLDGFDELLQAGAQQLDSALQWGYLQEVERFQRREAELGRPLIVIVTSRTVVADLAGIPPSSQVLRLEPFGESEIERWLAVWNLWNTDYRGRKGLQPLPVEDVLAHRELAAQPLLLLMLALYDASSNQLQGLREEDFGRMQLYDRLIGEFIGMQVVKDRPLPAAEINAAVEREVHRLSVVAFGMFHRGAQTISNEEAASDLQALDTSPPDGPGLLFGRFFFVHEAQAIVSEQRLRSYEFMHATFGEHLMARLIDRALRRLMEAEAPLNDGELYALLSFTPLTDRAQVVHNLRERLACWRAARLVEPLTALFRATEWAPQGRTHTGYRPRRMATRYRDAVYEANLLMVMVLAAGEVHASEVVGGGYETIGVWRRHALSWQAQLSSDSWDLFCSTLTLERRTREEYEFPLEDLRITAGHTQLVPHLLVWPTSHTTPLESLPERTRHRLDTTGITRLIRRSMFAEDSDSVRLLHLVYPMLLQFPESAQTQSSHASPTHQLLSLLTRDVYDPVGMSDRYRVCLRFIEHLDTEEAPPYLNALLRQLVTDAPTLPIDALAAVLTELGDTLENQTRLITQATEDLLLRVVCEAFDRGDPRLDPHLVPLRKFFTHKGDTRTALARLSHMGHSTLTWEWAGSLHGQPAARLLDDVLEELHLRTTAAHRPATIVALLRLAAELDLADWLSANAPHLLAALPSHAFGLLRPSDLGPLRAALPDGAYRTEFTNVERVWRSPGPNPSAPTQPGHFPSA